MSKPILRVGKIHEHGSATPASVQGHLCRSIPTPNAVPERTKNNVWLMGGPEENLSEKITEKLAKVGIERSSLRKDAVIANDILLTASPDWFRPDDPDAYGTWDADRLTAFRAEAETLLRKRFGNRVVCAVLHLDEASPHVQAVVLPVLKHKTEDAKYRLSSKDMFNPTNLRKLQQAWEDQLRPHGVGTRLKGSKARHTTIKDFYASTEAALTVDNRSALTVSDPPPKRLLEGSEAHGKRTKEWQKGEAKRLRDELRPLAVQAARGRLYEAERRSNSAIRTSLGEQGADLAEARKELAATKEELKLTKEQIINLRQVPINKVAAMLGYTQSIPPKTNAIDLVKLVGGLDYQGAISWLAQRFGAELAADAVRENALPALRAAETDEPVLSKSEKFKREVIDQQLSALAAPAYRITLMWVDENNKKRGINLGKQKDGGKEKTYTKDEILDIKMITNLTNQNANGRNVFITPLDPDAYHILLDDLKAEKLSTVKETRGYKSECILETSPNNYQFLIKVPTTLPKTDVNEWFKDLNRDLGDPDIVGLIHPLRLAGFQNRKEKYIVSDNGYRPFVRVIETTNRFCAHAMAVIKQYTFRRIAAERATAAAPKPPTPKTAASAPSPALRPR